MHEEQVQEFLLQQLTDWREWEEASQYDKKNWTRGKIQVGVAVVIVVVL